MLIFRATCATGKGLPFPKLLGAAPSCVAYESWTLVFAMYEPLQRKAASALAAQTQATPNSNCLEIFWVQAFSFDCRRPSGQHDRESYFNAPFGMPRNGGGLINSCKFDLSRSRVLA